MMISCLHRGRFNWPLRGVALFVTGAFFSTSIIRPPYAQAQMPAGLPKAGEMVPLSSPFASAIMKGLSLHPDNPLKFDFVIDSGEDNVRRAVEAFKALGFIPRAPVKPEEFISADNRERWQKEKGMRAFTFVNPKNPFENVDLLFSAPVPFEKAYRRKKTFRSNKISVPTVAVKDLIRMKRNAGRPHDLDDLAILNQIARARRGKL